MRAGFAGCWLRLRRLCPRYPRYPTQTSEPASLRFFFPAFPDCSSPSPSPFNIRLANHRAVFGSPRLLTELAIWKRWILASFFFACLWTSTSSRSINTQKKNLANIQPSWPHAWSDDPFLLPVDGKMYYFRKAHCSTSHNRLKWCWTSFNSRTDNKWDSWFIAEEYIMGFYSLKKWKYCLFWYNRW